MARLGIQQAHLGAMNNSGLLRHAGSDYGGEVEKVRLSRGSWRPDKLGPAQGAHPREHSVFT